MVKIEGKTIENPRPLHSWAAIVGSGVSAAHDINLYYLTVEGHEDINNINKYSDLQMYKMNTFPVDIFHDIWPPPQTVVPETP